MHILCDISHPADVYIFRHAIDLWRSRGHQVTLVARNKDLTLPLLDDYGYDYQTLSRARRGLLGLGLELLAHEGRLYQRCWRNPPDIFVEVGGTFIVHAAKLLRRPSVVLYDTEHAKLANAITYPFATYVCTPTCYQGDIGAKHIRYEGYQELAYLHPNRFSPDPSVLTEIGLSPDDPFFIIRFVNWAASHDIGQQGFSLAGKIKLVQTLAQHGRIFITSEDPLPEDLKDYRMPLSPTKIHHLLAFATLYIGEGATMASESAVLGIPSIFVSPFRLGYTDEQEKRYDLCYTISNQAEEEAIAKAISLIQSPNLKATWQAKRDHMLAEKIDVTPWLVEFVEEVGQANKQKTL